MAQRPTFVEKVNQIVRFIEDPCEAPWIVYLELAREPAKQALLTWVTFGLNDVMRGYFRPKGVRGRRHGRGRGKGGARAGFLARGLRRIPGIGDDVGDFIGKRLPGAKELKQRHVSQGVKNMWFVDGVLQRGLWWWLVIGLTTDFLFEWTTLLQQTEFCMRTNQDGLYSKGVPGGALAIQGWIAQAGLIEQRNWGHAAQVGPNFFLGAGRWTAIFALQMTQFGNPGPSTHECRIIDLATGGPIGASDGTVVEKGDTSTTIATADFDGPKSIQIQGRVSFAGGLGVSGDMWITGNFT